MYIIHHKSINNIVIERNGRWEREQAMPKIIYTLYHYMAKGSGGGGGDGSDKDVVGSGCYCRCTENTIAVTIPTKVISKCLVASYCSHLEMVSNWWNIDYCSKLTIRPVKLNQGGCLKRNWRARIWFEILKIRDEFELQWSSFFTFIFMATRFNRIDKSKFNHALQSFFSQPLQAYTIIIQFSIIGVHNCCIDAQSLCMFCSIKFSFTKPTWIWTPWTKHTNARAHRNISLTYHFKITIPCHTFYMLTLTQMHINTMIPGGACLFCFSPD